MDRLTYDFPFNGKHCWQIHGADNLECREVCERQGENGCIECPIAKAFDRLAAYENTGLEPEEIESLCDMDRREKMAEMLRIEEYFGVSIDRLRELVEADRDGRCVIIPVKEGDTVYHIRFHLFEDYPPEIFDAPFHMTDYYNIGNTVFLTEEDAEAARKSIRRLLWRWGRAAASKEVNSHAR